jgi:Rrf2 family protein|nr:MAG: Rrf2 family transcriptional regulator [Bacteroidota bacterium]
MLRLSKRIEYGLMAMQYLALSPAGASVSVREIAQRQGLPYELLAKIMQQLARRGLVRSRQGLKGGYQLAKPLQAITLKELAGALGQELSLVACESGGRRCSLYARCSLRHPLMRLEARLDRLFGQIPLSEFLLPPVTEPQITSQRSPYE